MSEGKTSESAFSQTLGELKHRGSNLLLVGTPDRETRRRASERLMGDPENLPQRRRLFVFTDNSYVEEPFVDATAERLRVVSCDRLTRSAAAASPSSTAPSSGGDVAHQQVHSDQLGELSWTIGQNIEELDTYDAGELRVCFDSLNPLVSEYSQPERMRFLHALTNRVRAAKGMAHYHLTAGRNDPLVQDIEPAFDAVIELRVIDGEPEQRWYIEPEGIDSGWLPL